MIIHFVGKLAFIMEFEELSEVIINVITKESTRDKKGFSLGSEMVIEDFVGNL